MAKRYTKTLECLCVKKANSTLSAEGGVLKAKLSCNGAAVRGIVSAESEINTEASRVRTLSSTPTAEGQVNSTLSVKLPFKPDDFILGDGEIINSGMTAVYSGVQDIIGDGELRPTFLDKYLGSFSDYECQEKLYPSGDLPIDDGFGYFVGPSNEVSNTNSELGANVSGLYNFIDEGVFTGDYDEPFGNSTLLADDANSFIHPYSFHTDGLFQYKGELTNFTYRPDETRVRIRASAPISNYEARIPPRYTIQNFKLEDPLGNLIARYEDVTFFGDVDYDNPKTWVNYATYSLKPTFNAAEQYDWNRGDTPYMHMVSGYRFSFEVKVEALDDAFDPGFDGGFEEDYIMPLTQASGDDYLALAGPPLSTQDQGLINPTNSLRISAIEICNSGGQGPRLENYVNLLLQRREKGNRIERKILPSFMPVADFDTGIYPSVSSVWYRRNAGNSGVIAATNLDSCGAQDIVHALRRDDTLQYAEMDKTFGVADSGKLTLVFSHGHDETSEITPGAFNCAFDQTTCPMWFSPSGAFNTENKSRLGFDANFFKLESITMKVKARKAVGSRDYFLDVVGFSDDGLLAVSTAVSGFLQNPSGVHINDQIIGNAGSHPVVSGFLNDGGDLGISTESLSEKERYVQSSGNLGGDHYALTQYPVVNTTDFADYEVPLQIYDDPVKLGKSRDYSQSPLFEKLYLDIFSIPSGADIASISLLVRYQPQSALKLLTQGGEDIRKIQDGRSEGSISPISMQSNDSILNAGSGYGPLSTIENIPHGYSTPSSIKSNYARRWKGQNGVVRGPYDPDVFGFGFQNPHVEFPFLSGYYTFDHLAGTKIISRNLGLGDNGIDFTLTGASIHDNIYKNIGWRFDSGSMFEDALPGYTGAYKTSDWTSLSKGAENFQTDPLYGKIADAFDTVVRVSGQGGKQYLNLIADEGIIDTSGGFSMFLRFTPDTNVSGIGYNLFNSGVLLSKWELANNLDFALGYSGGYLSAYAKDFENNIIHIHDTVLYSGYQYPLSVLLTYNDHNSSGLKLYVDNEFASGDWDVLRASSNPFRKINSANFGVDEPCLDIGWSKGSGVGMNMLVSEFGFSTYSSGIDTMYGSGTNVVESNPDRTYKQVTAQEFLRGHRSKFFDPTEPHTADTYKLWEYVDENTYSDWSLGDFQWCEFSPAYRHLASRIGKRTGRDLVQFHVRSSGYAYNSGVLASNWPASVSSGVSYHTQIENDFLRFHLSDTPSNFHSTDTRITKDLPRGYVFGDKALVAETVIEHETSGNISWGDCGDTIGPKLIVSLYTKNQDPYWTPDNPWGLINRDIHYIDPSSCMFRFDSKFHYDSVLDESEDWAIFPESRVVSTEFKEKYYSKDVDDMFLQYDLVYPSGGQYESKIYIHSAHVRLEDAYVKSTSDSGILNMAVNSQAPVPTMLDLVVSGMLHSSGSLPLNTEGTIPVKTSGSLPLSFPQRNISLDDVLLYILGGVKQSGEMLLNVSGGIPVQDTGVLNINISGAGPASGIFPLVLGNFEYWRKPSGVIPLNIYVASEADNIAVRDDLRLRIHNIHSTDLQVSGNMVLTARGSQRLTDVVPDASVPLFISAPTDVSGAMNLVIYQKPEEFTTTTGGTDAQGNAIVGMPLFTANYGGTGSSYLRWFNENYGTGITIEDNVYTSVPVGNEIRGVDLIGYGSCTSDSPSKAIDRPLITDETIWRPETCEDGGIFRAKNTYTNSGALYFDGTTNGNSGYSGNYYGIRKITGLIPNMPYSGTLKVTTGHTDPIKVPRDFEEWEYGMCGPDWYDSGCCTADCDQNIVFSGFKFIADDPYLSGDASITPPDLRSSGFEYGTAVAVHQDLMAVGSPKSTILDVNGHEISGAGSVFLYRRNEDVAGKKASWTMEDQLMLPSGFRRDYISHSVPDLVVFDQFSISGNKWNIGQEGRRFGSSIDMSSSGDAETLIIGAPHAQWSRQFQDIPTSGIPVCMMVFVDQFDKEDGLESKISLIANAARKWDILYKYFSAPWNAGSDYEFYPQLEIKILLYQLVFNDEDQTPVKTKYSDWFRHNYLPRLDDKDLKDAIGGGAVYNEMYSGIKEGFNSFFPDVVAGPHSGIPPIVGVFEDHSHSTKLGGAFSWEGNSVIDAFEDHYNLYSFRSGVTIPENDNNAASGFVRRTQGAAENWDVESRKLMNETLDSGFLITTPIPHSPVHDLLSFITSGVGQEWGDTKSDIAYNFQVPPASGGRAYIFEKESGVFNCVQEIVPFDEREGVDSAGQGGGGEGGPGGLGVQMGYGNQYNDRFGHAVAISKDVQTISIGSPFSYVPCEIFKRNEDENLRMYDKIRDWLVFRGFTTETARYDQLATTSGALQVQKTIYNELIHTNKFWLRTDENFWGDASKTIKLYQPIFNYKYRDIKPTGTWQFILNEFLGTSRLGYSTSVNDDGTTVAFGAPTDSMNEFDDSNVWFKGYETWYSYTNAGAVRIFESKEYNAHSGVVEFTRFGNLDRATHPSLLADGFYDQMPLYFSVVQSQNYLTPPYVRRTEFEEIEIPRDAGLAFIITPELDAASDEIINNIKDWLILGDRTLVLVGNDPVWEDNGIYRKSNDIINKILQKLGSRMRITAADTEYESLQGCISDDDIVDDKYNITVAHQPAYNHTLSFDSPIHTGNIFAKGVGDIRIDVSDLGLENLFDYGPCDSLNQQVCPLPIAHSGDLRSQWSSECVKTQGGKVITVPFQTSWGFHFANPNPAKECDDYPISPKPYINRPYQDIRPVLTAAEIGPDQYYTIPAESGYVPRRVPVYGWVMTKAEETLFFFDEEQQNHVSFNIEEDVNSNISGIYDYWRFDQNRGGFIDPDKVNGRDSLIQGIGSTEQEFAFENKVLSDKTALLVKEQYNFLGEYTGSDVYIMASVNGENKESFDDGAGNSDQNILFYTNLVTTDCNTISNVKQLGGWTKRTSFADAYSKSILPQRLVSDDQDFPSFALVEENYDPRNNGRIEDSVDVIWIANPDGRPDATDVAILSDWLRLGNRRIIITYSAIEKDKREVYAENVSYICEQLGLESRPFIQPCRGGYFVTDGSSVVGSNRQSCCPLDGLPVQILNEDEPPVKGCTYGYDWMQGTDYVSLDTKIEKVSLRESEGGQSDENVDFFSFIPISGGGAYENIIHYVDNVTDTCPVSSDQWFLECNASGRFDVEEGSGYRVFVNWVSENTAFKQESYPIQGILNQVTTDPSADGSPGPPIFNQEGGGLIQTPHQTVQQAYLDVKALNDEMGIVFDTSFYNLPKGITEEELIGLRGLPTTPRIFSISGCPLGINEYTTPPESSYQIIRYDVVYDFWYKPAQTGVIPGQFRPISHKSEEYCDPFSSDCPPRGDNVIEDGPVVVAEEFEHFSPGLNGHRRSKIVVVTDSTIIQGQCPNFRSDALNENQKFIRSLYPKSPHERGEDDLGFDFKLDTSTQFQFTQKLRGPDRSSPLKNYAVNVIANTIKPLYDYDGLAGDLNKYTDIEDTYHPADVVREPNPVDPRQFQIEIRKFGEESNGGGSFEYKQYPRFSGDFLKLGAYPTLDSNADFLVDADRLGGPSELMKFNGTDYLDFDLYNSGCPGDLFGFSVDLTQDRLIVGTPFHPLVGSGTSPSGLVSWSDIVNDPNRIGMSGSQQGGAGAAFYYERTTSGKNVVSERLPWEFKQKIKPSSINIGLDQCTVSRLQIERGNHDLNNDFILEHAGRTDQFGYSVAIDADMIVVGAPNHDFQTLHHHIYSGASAFQRKSFNGEYMIPGHSYYDLGSSGVRFDKFGGLSGTMILNQGAVFNYRYQMVDWQKREQVWQYADKLTAQHGGFKSAIASVFAGDTITTSGNENDNFGKSVAIYRAERGDSDYTLAVGSPRHDFATSGNHISASGIENAGAAYQFDAMLREQIPAIPAQGGWIEGRVFGGKTEDGQNSIKFRVEQPTVGDPVTINLSGIIVSNYNGDIFLEASGYDGSEKGFIAHRPFVESLIGDVLPGSGLNETLGLLTSGKAAESSGTLPLSIVAPDTANVYNNMNLSLIGVSGLQSGIMNLGINSFTFPSGSLGLNIEGRDASEFEQLLLRLRGK